MNYRQFKENQQKELNKFPLGCAFDKAQLIKMKEELPLKGDSDKYLSIGGGCFIRKSDEKAFDELNEKLSKEKKEFITCNFYDAVLYELNNHEYCYTRDYDEALEALNLKYEGFPLSYVFLSK